MKKTLLALFALSFALVCAATPWADYVQMTVHERLAAVPAPHPRLLADADAFARVRASTNELVRLGRERVIFVADQLRRAPLPRRVLEGKRLLTVSQRALERITALAMAYRLTDDARYATRAIAEAETVCAFRDWNPAHFLDTAEMTLAVAIAYDWLYDALTPAQRTVLKTGLVANGLRDAKTGDPKTGGWVNAANNWGQVCHGGLAAGAIAVMDEEPALAEKILVRAITALPRPMQAFAPAGGFAEGPAQYWSYAMTFNVVAIDAVERVFGTDFGLCDLPGFKASADYLDSLTGPTGLLFNYADAGISPRQDRLARRGVEACSWWLARRFNRPDTLTRFALPLYRAQCADRAPLNLTPRRAFQRLFPLALLWMDAEAALAAQGPATPLCRVIPGVVPVSVQRTGWDANAWFVGLKGGTAQVPHGHLDIGSFVLDAKGARWACDIGSEDYFRMEFSERKGNIWDLTQGSLRWKIFRLGPESHNILQINAAYPYVAGRATVVAFTNEPLSKVTYDLTPVYPGATRVTRTGTLVPGGGYILEDHLEGLHNRDVVRWQMLTPARVKTIERNVLTLAQKAMDGEPVELTLTAADRHAQWVAEDVSAVPGPDESPNPGLTRVFFTQLAPTNGIIDVAVHFSDEH